MNYVVNTGNFSRDIVFANKEAFEASQAHEWATNRIKVNQEKITKLNKQMNLPRNAEYKGEFIEEIEEIKFYNQYLPEFAEMKWNEFKEQGGIINC